MKFNRLSPNADLYSKLQSDLLLINKNVLYITHVVDRLDIKLTKFENSFNLQKQVDDFYEETSPQTERIEQ